MTCSPSSATAPAITGDDLFDAAMPPRTCSTRPRSGPPGPATYRRLADLEPKPLAIMHGSSYEGDCPALLRTMADVYEQRFGCGGRRPGTAAARARRNGGSPAMTAATEAMRHRTRPRQPAVDHATAKRLAAAEYDRFTGQLQDLAPGEWARPTTCPAWDVHAIA